MNKLINTLSNTSEFTYNHSDTVSYNEKSHKLNQNGGGLFCDDELTNILLKCFTDERPDIVCYLLCKLNKNPEKITKINDIKRNLFHYFTIYASHSNMIIHLSTIIRKTCSKTLKKVLNAQDIYGNTPLHYATELGYNNLVKLFIDNGADSSIQNKNGEYIKEDINKS